MKHSRLAGLLISLSLFQSTVGLASGVFSDVSDSHTFKGEIESLTRSGILKGNPDGKFYPDRSVNRAEFLKMLYMATARDPKTIYAGCFSDVETGSWYESFVCDAAAKENGFVKGYSDGKFRPASPVSRTEALKMLFMLFRLSAPDISQNDKDIIKFVDVSTSSWYSKYLSAAYKNGILPITGFAGTRFYPDKELLRGEAATYIFNAQRAKDLVPQSSASSVSSVSTSSSAASDILKTVAFPFTESGTFIAKHPAAYLFNLAAPMTIFAQVSVSGFYPSDVSCRLYLLDGDGFSSEYYLGYQEKSMCSIRASLKAGNYQWQIQPTVENVPYTVMTKTATGDGNDGFVNAVTLKSNMPRTDVIDSGDLFDWYAFSVSADTNATIEVSSGESLSCIIYTPASVDQFGFTGPECGKAYLFQKNGSNDPYVVGIGRKSGDSVHKVPYTVKMH